MDVTEEMLQREKEETRKRIDMKVAMDSLFEGITRLVASGWWFRGRRTLPRQLPTTNYQPVTTSYELLALPATD
jgi:hypothetical protein